MPDARVEAGGPPRSAPHGAAIRLVAVTDAGDAALTVDERDHVRLWPTLDGDREPVIVHAPVPRQLALGRDGAALVAVVLDAAGGIELIRFDRSGMPRGRARVATEPAAVQVVAVAGGVLARRSDHAVVWLDAGGRVRATLVPEPGEQVVTLAARRGSAFAAIADPDRPEVKELRRIELRGGARWGGRTVLPEPLTSAIALAPSGRRLAGVMARTPDAVAIIDIVPAPKLIAREPVNEGSETALGFVDEDHVVVPAGHGFTIGGRRSTDPWASDGARWQVRSARGAAIADQVVSPTGTALALSTPERTMFLGYRDLAIGDLRRAADRVTLVSGERVVWLDDRLHAVKAAAIASGLRVLDDKHAVRTVWGQSVQRSHLIDVDTGIERDLGPMPTGGAVAYEPRTRVLVFAAGREPGAGRLQIDLATGTATVLRALKTPTNARIDPLDPELAGGVVAVSFAALADGGSSIETFVDDGKPTRRLLEPSTRVKLEDVAVLGVDRAGVAWVVTQTAPQTILGYRNGKRVARFASPGLVYGGAVAADGSTLIVHDLTQVYALDARGTERWRAQAWHVAQAVVGAESQVIYLVTSGGLITLDAASGRRLATGCGWGFARSAIEPNQVEFGDSPVCADGDP